MTPRRRIERSDPDQPCRQPAPAEDLVAADLARSTGEGPDEATYGKQLAAAVTEVVARQRELGIDIVNDGEYGHAMGEPYDYGAWWSYIFPRLGGLELDDTPLLAAPQARPKPGEVALASFEERRDWQQFSEAYADPSSGAALPNRPPVTPVARAAITYAGQEMVQRDIANVKAALDAHGLKDGYLNSVAPGSCARFGNEYYDDDEALMYACADAMREEYTAIIDAGLMLQLDDPAIAENWDQINPAPSVEAYQRFTRVRVEALNHAIRDLPPTAFAFTCAGAAGTGRT